MTSVADSYQRLKSYQNIDQQYVMFQGHTKNVNLSTLAKSKPQTCQTSAVYKKGQSLNTPEEDFMLGLQPNSYNPSLEPNDVKFSDNYVKQ